MGQTLAVNISSKVSYNNPRCSRPGISLHVKGKKELILGDYRPKSSKLKVFWPLKGKSWAIFSFHAALFQFRCPITSGMTQKDGGHDAEGWMA